MRCREVAVAHAGWPSRPGPSWSLRAALSLPRVPHHRGGGGGGGGGGGAGARWSHGDGRSSSGRGAGGGPGHRAQRPQPAAGCPGESAARPGRDATVPRPFIKSVFTLRVPVAERRTEAEPVNIGRFQRTGDVIAGALKLRRSDQTMVAGDLILARLAPAAVAAQRIGGGPLMDPWQQADEASGRLQARTGTIQVDASGSSVPCILALCVPCNNWGSLCIPVTSAYVTVGATVSQ